MYVIKNNLFVYILIENLFRSASLHKDFPHLYLEFYKSENTFQNDNPKYNLLRVRIFPKFNFDKLNESKAGQAIVQDFSYMAENLVEHKPFTEHAISWQKN